jgi:chromosome segregation ATPase
VVARAKARATRAQLIADQIQLENRLRKLPGEVKAAEKDACYTEQAVQDARRLLETKLKAHDEALAKLDQLHEELMASEAELAAINAELEKLAEQV